MKINKKGIGDLKELIIFFIILGICLFPVIFYFKHKMVCSESARLGTWTNVSEPIIYSFGFCEDPYNRDNYISYQEAKEIIRSKS